MKKNLCGAIALALGLLLLVPAAASDFSIAVPEDERDGNAAENPFPNPIYEAINFDDFVKATATLLSMYETIDSHVGGEYASARLIVKANKALPDLSGYRVAQILVDAGHTYLIQFKNPEDAEACDAYLKTLPEVEFSEPDKEVSLPEPEKGPSEDGAMSVDGQSYSWGVEATKLGEYAKFLKTKGGASEITVAVVDSGVDSSHPFLTGRLTAGRDLVDNDDVPQDGKGHGTHVTGTIVDCTPEMNVRVMPVRVLNNSGSGSSSVVGLGIQYAAEHGAKVINMSLGGFGHSEYIDSQIKSAVAQNVVVVVAAGNDNQDTKYYCPAGDAACITVAAVDKNKMKASFSNYGEAVDLAAPGVDIQSSVPGGGYESKSGTSMATPHVAAAAALLLCQNPSQTPAQIEKKLRDAAEDLGNSGWDRYYGAGFLNMSAFIGVLFDDVSPNAYYYSAVKWAVEQGITNGTTSTTFSPNQTCTTKQILTFMWRADGSPTPQSADAAASDFVKALTWAGDKNISTSVSASAEEACTRSSAMTYMWTHAGMPSSGNNPFSDVPNNSYYAQSVCWAVQKGITNGTTETTFSPDNPCTRAQIMTFLYRYYVKAVNA